MGPPGWQAHLVLAEAVRLGAKLWCSHIAEAPFAAEFAGAECFGLSNPSRVIGYPDGCRSMVHGPELVSLPRNVPIAAVGRTDGLVMDGSKAALWLNPPTSTDTRNLEPLCTAIPNLWMNQALPEPLKSALMEFAAGLRSGARDPWDWVQSHMAERPSFGCPSWAVPGHVSFDLNPLGLVLATDRPSLRQLMAAGRVPLTAARPGHLRIPLLDTSGALVEITVRASGTLQIKTEPAHPEVNVDQTPSPNGCTILLSAAAPLTSVDLILAAKRGEITRVMLRLPTGDREDAGSADPLERYGDPLDEYVGAEAS